MSFGSRYSRMDQVKFVEDSLKKIWSDFVCLGRPYHFKFYKGCILLILLGPFVNTLTHLIYQSALPLILLISRSINKKITTSNIKRLYYKRCAHRHFFSARRFYIMIDVSSKRLFKARKFYIRFWFKPPCLKWTSRFLYKFC